MRTQAVRNPSMAHGHDCTNIRFWEVSVQTVHPLFQCKRNAALNISFGPAKWHSKFGKGEGGTNYRDPTFQKGARCPKSFRVLLPFSVASLLVGCTEERMNRFRPSSNQWQSFGFSVNILSRSALVGGRDRGGIKFFFYQASNPLSAAQLNS
jgi:hypothetical protein